MNYGGVGPQRKLKNGSALFAEDLLCRSLWSSSTTPPVTFCADPLTWSCAAPPLRSVQPGVHCAEAKQVAAMIGRWTDPTDQKPDHPPPPGGACTALLQKIPGWVQQYRQIDENPVGRWWDVTNPAGEETSGRHQRRKRQRPTLGVQFVGVRMSLAGEAHINVLAPDRILVERWRIDYPPTITALQTPPRSCR
jgi:hypothetical protein